MIDVIGIDAPCMDFLVNLEKLPHSNCSMPILRSSWQGGGKAATAMVALARLGGRCGIVADIGSDLFGDVIEWDFRRHGIDTTCLRRVPDKGTSLSLVLSDRETNGRSVIWQGGGTALVQELDAGYLRQARYLHVPNVTGVFGRAMEIVREAGGQVVIDADRYDPAIMDKLSMIDVFIASEFFFDSISDGRDVETCCREVQAQGPSIVVFTFGEKGCAGIGPDGAFFRLPAFSVPVMDTTGAGDVFHGAFLYGLLQGWDAERCARWSSAVSAIKITRLGGRAGIPDAAMTERFLQTGEIDGEALDARVQWYEKALEHTLQETGRRT